MNIKVILIAAIAGLITSCETIRHDDPLPSWNETPIKQQLLHFINEDVEQIPVENRVAVFDMDGTLICERPYGIETVVSIHRIVERGKTEPEVRQWKEYELASKLAVNHNDTAAWNHMYDDGQNYRWNMLIKAFDGADMEDYVSFTTRCLNTEVNSDYGLTYADMCYQPMLELVEALKAKQFEVYVVSGSMEGIVWGICPQMVGLERKNLLGIRHKKEVHFTKGGPISYTIGQELLEPINDYLGKAINIYDHIGKVPVVAVGNNFSDLGMFHMAACSQYPHLGLLLHHDDAEREYQYGYDKSLHDTLSANGWLRADMSKEFKVVWKKK